MTKRTRRRIDAALKYGVVALSEGLRAELKPRGIGVSVLCPGFVRTNIADSWRHLPQRFDPGFLKPLAKLASSEIAQMIRARIAYGIDPLYVGELVREGVENDWFYIFTDAEF